MEKVRTRTRGLLLLIVCATALVLTAVALAWPDQKSAPSSEHRPVPKPTAEEPLPVGGASQAALFSPA